MIGRVYFGEEMIQEADDEFYLCLFPKAHLLRLYKRTLHYDSPKDCMRTITAKGKTAHCHCHTDLT